jgi:hypothetical protein
MSGLDLRRRDSGYVVCLSAIRDLRVAMRYLDLLTWPMPPDAPATTAFRNVA